MLKTHRLSHAATGRFSGLVNDFLARPERLQAFLGPQATDAGLAEAIENRRRFATDREGLCKELHRQYEGLSPIAAVQENINLLRQPDTFSICTAHQPALLTGAWYFIYKILHTVALCRHLKKQFPQQDFVPVFYIGSEDNDLEELGHFYYQNERYDWDGGGQTGAVGRMKTDTLKLLLRTLFQRLGPPGEHAEALVQILTNAYRGGQTIAAATRTLVAALLGPYGVVVIDGDSSFFKQKMVSVFHDDLFAHTPYKLVEAQSKRLNESYKAQAFPREINLFYLDNGIRERIEKDGDNWVIKNTEIRWNRQELETLLQEHPEKFSPNVVLRGLYQETILPNIAFIGGGAEVAYWMQFKTLFQYYKVPFPAIILRQSFQWMGVKESKLLEKLELPVEAVFEDAEKLLKAHIEAHRSLPFDQGAFEESIAQIVVPVAEKAAGIDASLHTFMEAEMHRFRKSAARIGKKIFQAEKRKQKDWQQRLLRVQESMLPGGGLQERKATFLDYYPAYGPALFDLLLDATHPYGKEFVLLEETQS